VDGARSFEAAATGAGGLHFQLLGPLEASRDGVRLDLGPRKQRAVLALLLLSANRIVPTERLIDDLWGDAPPETARSALQVYVAGLRKALGTDGAALRTHAPGYMLELEPGALDLDRFVELRTEARACEDDERRAGLLRDALALWRDAPLAELSTEPFLTAAVAQLEQLRLDALEERIDADLALGRHAALVAELERLVGDHPYRERPRAQLMLALYRSGRQAEALDVYQAGRRVLSDELGLKPGKELRELEAAILRQDDVLGGGRRVVPIRPHAETAEGEGAAAPLRPLSRVSRLYGRPAILLAGVIAGLAAAAAAGLLLRAGPAPITALPNSVAVIDARTNRVVAAVPVGIRPGPVAVGAGSVWVGNLEDKTLSRIDPATRRIVKTISLGATPTAIDVGAGAIWVAHGLTGKLSRVDPQFGQVSTVDVTGKSLYFSSAGVAVDGGWVWAVYGDSTLARLTAAGARKSGSTLAGQGPTAVLVESGSVWVSNTGDATVQRFDPITFEEGPLRVLNVGSSPSAMAGAEGVLWVASRGDDALTRIDAGSGSTFTIPVGDGPAAVAVGAGAVWVANAAGTVSRVDPETSEVMRTIDVGSAPAGIAVVDGLVWVAVQGP
jgi:YVTN family beta-propeller protein